MKITIHEKEPAIRVNSIEELDSVLFEAANEAKLGEKLNIIYLEADNGNAISIAVGGDETVLGFTYSHNNPPYYASRGISGDEEPVLTAYVYLEHHTEYPRRNVIPIALAISAIHEFIESGELPASIQWIEV